jgi:hypothetical protein
LITPRIGGRAHNDRMKISQWLVLIAALALPLAANGGPMKAGKWQITVTTKIAGMDDAVPPTTVTECVTAEDAANPQPPAAGPGSDCKISDYKIAGNVITWSIACPTENMTGTGRMTFSGDTYTGETSMKVGDASVTQTLSGKYLGACDK